MTELRFKDFYRKLAPFRDESMEQLLQEQVNEWIKLNKPRILGVETLWERNSHVSVGVRIWYIQE
ncbi:MAG: hypothetical protein N2648_07110 [Aquificaceae bacterium]|nr:hypothetical protein [Aquificaceae bacterium]MCS7196070.1 hypothetical protein [Aquificaceae bacterium]MCX7990384.1 hypothetical protein [Aquificaceae bacterium]MDW8032300.1 hypothetical protein [Aquificaceae bacterium]MDW8294428.1 hypothetical protein [Aquificaceae bacterium]